MSDSSINNNTTIHDKYVGISNMEEKEEESITSAKDDDGSDCNATGIVDASLCKNKIESSLLDKGIWNYLIVIFYILGISWFLCHPIVSVITGELKCRGSYLDEAQLDAHMFRSKNIINPYDNIINNNNNNNINYVDAENYSLSLCEKVSSLGKDDIFNNYDNISCHSHLNQMDVVRLIPHQNQIVPTDALVLFIPSSNNKDNDSWNNLFLALIQQLSTKSWLKKTILLVSPKTSKFSLERTVDAFLKAYLGDNNNNKDQIGAPLPTSYTGYMIRQLLVFDFTTTSANTDDDQHSKIIPVVEVLPQGKRGVLPNLDLVFATISALSNVQHNKIRHTVVTHPFTNHPTFQKYQQQIISAINYLPTSTQTHRWLNNNWVKEFCNMIAFMTSLILGPYPPHEVALQRGIDSLTIRIQMNPYVKNELHPVVMRDVEYLLRGLSGLNERLHHSTTLYLMPSAEKFVSNGEYIYPAILLLLPLLIRVILLILRDIKTFHPIKSTFSLLAMTMGLSTLLLITNSMITTTTTKTTTGHHQNNINSLVMNLILISSYGIIIWYNYPTLSNNNMEQQRLNVGKKQGIQALACLLAIYFHVPLILAHISLAYPSCLMWSLFLAHSFF